MAAHHFPWREAYINALRHRPVVQYACDIVGIERSTAWRARKDDPKFAAEEAEALEAGVDKAEAEAFRRGVDGYHEPVIHKGQLSYITEPVLVDDDDGQREVWRAKLDDKGRPIPLTVLKHSDAMLGRVLAARRASYRTSVSEISNPDGSLIDPTAREARVAQLLAAAQARADAAKAQRVDPNEFA